MTELKRNSLELESWKKEFKKQGNKGMWHQVCQVEKLVKQTPNIEDKLMLINHALDVIHKTFSKYI